MDKFHQTDICNKLPLDFSRLEQWKEISYSPAHPNAYPLSCVTFDDKEEFIWTGSFNGRISCQYSPSLNNRAYFIADPLNCTINGIISHEESIFSLNSNEIRVFSKGGLLKSHFSVLNEYQQNVNFKICHDKIINITNTSLLMIDIQKEKLIESFEFDDNPCIMSVKDDGNIIIGSTIGSLYFFNINSFKSPINSIKGIYHGPVCDMDNNNFNLASCGFTSTQYDIVPDRLIKIIDIRNYRMLPPITFNHGAFKIRYAHKYNKTLAIADVNSNLRFIDTQSYLEFPSVFTIDNNIGCLSSMNYSYSNYSQQLAFTNNEGIVRLWSDSDIDQCFIHTNVINSEYVSPYPSQTYDNDMPFSYYNQEKNIGDRFDQNFTFSNWSFPLVIQNSRSSLPPVDPALINNITFHDFIGTAPLPNNIIPNCIESIKQFTVAKKNTSFLIPNKYTLFLDPGDLILKSRPNIKNSTPFSGISNSSINSYFNAFLQVLYYLPIFKNEIINHLCMNDICLTCELSFLFQMLKLSTQKIVEPRNFNRIFGQVPQSGALGLLDSSQEIQAPISIRIQNFSSFLLEHLYKEYRNFFKTKSNTNITDIEKIFGVNIKTSLKCLSDNKSVVNVQTYFQINLNYPNNRENITFTKLLYQSLCQSRTLSVFCPKCSGFRTAEQSKIIINCPKILLIGANINSANDLELWRSDSNWLLHSFSLDFDEKGDIIIDKNNEKNNYQLSAVTQEGIDHLIAHINITTESLKYHDENLAGWYLFNDLNISRSSLKDACDFKFNWKQPCVLIYTLKENICHEKIYTNQNQYFSYFEKASKMPSLSMRFNKIPRSLDIHSLNAGSLVSIDAEFVASAAEERGIGPDGRSIIISPARLLLARVSVIRGDNEEVLMDDHIMTNESIADYLTLYSGVRPGDLDPRSSPYYLTSLKCAYIKLIALVRKGVIFIGHGLSKDFQMINMIVPNYQIIDTVEIFRIPKQRYLSLRFLMKYLLKTDIQVDTHDSVEDALAALKLYKKYQELKANNTFESVLNQLYDIGHKTNWKLDK